MDTKQGVRVFFSYSHKDESYLDELRTHLANLREEGLICDWHDRAIRPGEEWEAAILDHLNQADVIVLLVSPDFNASNFCRRVEMARAIQRHQEGTALLVPMVVRQVESLPAEIAHLQAIPKDLKPISSFRRKDEGYVQVARALRSVLEGFAPRRRSGDSPARTVAIDLPATRPVEVCCAFRACRDAYQLELTIGFDRAQTIAVPRPVHLGPSERLRLGGVESTLGEIVARLADGTWEHAAWLDERGQLEIGRKLFEETFGGLEPLAGCDAVDLRIVADEEHLLRLPWPLLNRRGILLIHEAWSMSFSADTQPMQPVTLASHPHVLIVNPDPYPDLPTGGADHANDLRALLRGDSPPHFQM